MRPTVLGGLTTTVENWHSLHHIQEMNYFSKVKKSFGYLTIHHRVDRGSNPWSPQRKHTLTKTPHLKLCNLQYSLNFTTWMCLVYVNHLSSRQPKELIKPSKICVTSLQLGNFHWNNDPILKQEDPLRSYSLVQQSCAYLF